MTRVHRANRARSRYGEATSQSGTRASKLFKQRPRANRVRQSESAESGAYDVADEISRANRANESWKQKTTELAERRRSV
jgi:hypothetical protein